MKGHRRSRGSAVRKRESDRLRAMYGGGAGNATARRYAWFWNMVFCLGLLPRRWVTLEVRGRRTGRVARFPLGMADGGGQWYVVSMLGECNWVRNVRVAGGRATLRRRGARAVRLVEVPVEERAPVIRRYVERVPGSRPHIPVDRHELVGAFETIASNYPVFRVCAAVVVHLSQRPVREASRMPIRLRPRVTARARGSGRFQACCPSDPRTRPTAGQTWRGGRLRVSLRRSQGDHRRHARLPASDAFALSEAPEHLSAAGRVGPVGGPYGGLPRLAPVPRVAPTVALLLRALSGRGALRTGSQRLISQRQPRPAAVARPMRDRSPSSQGRDQRGPSKLL